MASKTIYVVLQEGGSSIECYASSYDNQDDALDAMIGHAKATYRSAGPFAVDVHEIDGKTYIEEGDALALAELAQTTDYE
jgi:hypothetical protein